MTDAWLAGVEGEYVPRLILSDAPVIRVVAGPGAGKTFGLKRRIQRLLEKDSVEPSRIYIGTFTRAIAEELGEELGDHVVRGVTVSTIHALAYRLLRENPPAALGHELRFLLAYEETAMLQDVGRALEDGLTIGQRRTHLKRLQAAWSQRRDLPDAAFAGEVDRWLRSHRALLIGEVVPLALRGLESGDIPPGSFDHVIVDEYQDLTASEQALVDHIWSEQGSLVVVGDDDQSIYSFRYNHPRGIAEVSERWTVEDIALPENRRCGQDIVTLANTIIAEGGSTKEPMIPRSNEAGSVSLVQWTSSDDEVTGLARYLVEKTDDFLVLVPRRFIGHRLRDSIGPEASTSFYQQVLQQQVVEERFALASLLADPSDPVAVRAWLGFKATVPEQAPRRNSVAYASVAITGERGQQLIEGIASGRLRPAGQGSAHLRARAESAMLALADAPQAVDERIHWVFDTAAAEAVPDAEKRAWAAADLELLASAAEAVLTENPDSTLPWIVRVLRYRIATRAPLGETARSRIRIMTLHSAKGLESERTVIAGVADEMVPGPPSDDVTQETSRQEEQRRLFYVAATRPKRELVVSWPRCVTYEDAKRNGVTIDPRTIFTADGVRHVRTARSRFIPPGFGVPVSGEIWLDDRLPP